MKTNWGSGVIAPSILNIGARWRWLVSFTLCLYPTWCSQYFANFIFEINWEGLYDSTSPPVKKRNREIRMQAAELEFFPGVTG